MQVLRGRTTGIDQLAISSDGRFLVAGSTPFHVWDLDDPKAKPRLISRSVSGSYVHEFQFASPTHIFAGTVQPWRWYRYDAKTGEEHELAPAHDELKRSACIHPLQGLFKGITSASFHEPQAVQTFRVTAHGLSPPEMTRAVAGHVRLLGFNPSGDRYHGVTIFADSGPAHQLFDGDTDAVVGTFAVPDQRDFTHVFAWCFTPDGRSLLVSTRQDVLRYDAALGGPPVARVGQPLNPGGERPGAACHPGGHMLATSNATSTVTFRDTDTLAAIRTYDFAMPKVTCVAFTPDGTRCVVGNSRGKVLLFDVDE